MPTLNLSVSASDDDAKQDPDGTMNLSAGNINLSGSGRWGGFRFNTITIPQGATITSATFRVDLLDTSSDDPSGTIYGHDVDNAGAFTTTSNDISDRSLTSATVSVSDSGAGAGVYDLPDVAAIIQEIVNRAGWVSGNSIVLLIQSTSSAFRIRSFDNVNNSTAATLEIVYTTGVVTPPLSVPNLVKTAFARVLLANRNGRIIAEIDALLGPVSWRMGKVGKVTLAISRRDLKLKEDYLRLANRILIQFSNGLPDWGGVIDFPETWSGDSVTITAYSGEYLLALHVTEKNKVFSTATIGTIFSDVIITANNAQATGVVVGQVWSGGNTHDQDYHFATILSLIQNTLTGSLSTADFYVTPQLSNGNLSFIAHLVERRGTDKKNIALLEEHNVFEINRTRQGPVFNSVYLAGANTSNDPDDKWGDGRLTSNRKDQASINEIGLRETSINHSSVKSQSTLDTEAEVYLSSVLKPKNTLVAKALNLAPAAFANYDLGDSMPAYFYSYGFGEGFSGTVQVIGREFFPDAGICDLHLQEVV